MFHYSLRAARMCGLVLVGAALAASSGCAIMQSCGCMSPPPGPPVNQVTAFWYEQIHYAADTEHGGRPMPGLAGRVWLSSDDLKQMVEADGMIFADLYDATPGSEGRKLADWRFDRENLKLLKKTDMIGLGYTLFLPWETYRPEVKKVQLRVAYQEKNGANHFAEPQLLVLKTSDHTPPLVQQVDYTWTPDQHRTPMPPTK